MLPRSLTLTLLAAAFLPSCAYMQTHKNVREQGQSYQGYQLTKPGHIYQSKGHWYIAATPATYRRTHDVVHDKVFRKTQPPVMELLTREPSAAYHRISPHTAAVLLRRDGYVDSTSLAHEVEQNATPWLTSLPHAAAHAVKAEVAGPESNAITYQPTPGEVPLRYRILSGLDLVFVDVPGTIAYNVAVPFIAPFIFFYEFLQN